ncbi:MAG TPA: GTPase domain-containing protein [Propionicimonas sp.]|nr:GTPase domain-containing protein [Propionicimonas sp.]HQA78417.1 GTPase domain-containing protein [Propionicimonas sp.]HQD96386.1 GTPase domain-containing protein [Propionicimonas sp.]
MSAGRLAASLVRLRDALAGVRLPLELPGSADALARARGYVAQLDDYVLPRLDRLDAPLLAVIGGSTGAGKSTLVNSLLGRVVTAPGVIRPTTRSPVLVHHPDDAEWFASDKILPGLARSTRTASDARTLQVVAEPTLPRGLAILDAPDVDSVVAENRALAAQLLAAADLWLFVTTAARYADAVPWDYLRTAAERHAVVAVVLDRVPPAAMGEVPAHLGQMMGQRGLGSSPLFAVPETDVDATGLLPNTAVAPIRDWLGELAADAVSRNRVVLQTLDGAIGALLAGAPGIAAAAEAQAASLDTLRSDAEKSFAEAVRTISVQTADGTLLRGEVLARWHDFVGTGEFFRAVEQKIGWLRDRLVAAIKGEPKQALDMKAAVESGMEVLIREEGEAAARRVESAWQAHPAGRELLAATKEDLSRASRDYPLAAANAVRSWQGDVLELVSREGAAKKSAARFWALGVNGVGVALMVLVFSQTGGLIGAEVGVAGGTAVLAQRVLEAIFGEDAVRRLAKQAKTDLDARVEAVLAAELSRYLAAVDGVDAAPDQAEQLLAAVAEVDATRAADGRLTLPGELALSDQPVSPARLVERAQTPSLLDRSTTDQPVEHVALPNPSATDQDIAITAEVLASEDEQ